MSKHPELVPVEEERAELEAVVGALGPSSRQAHLLRYMGGDILLAISISSTNMTLLQRSLDGRKRLSTPPRRPSCGWRCTG